MNLPPYKIERNKKRRRTVSIVVKNNAEVVVFSPMKTSVKFIHEFVEKNISWIEKKRNSILEQQKKQSPRLFQNNEEIYYLGNVFKLRVIPCSSTKTRAYILESNLYIERHIDSNVKEILENFYIAEAKKHFTKRLQYFAQRENFIFSKLKIRNTKTRWGSCSPDNNICLTWKLMHASEPIIDYVIVHELVHTKIKNHSEKFWNKLESILPLYKEHKNWLRDNADLISNNFEYIQKDQHEVVTQQMSFGF